MKEKLTAKEILDRAYVDVSIANLERRKREIIEDTERFLASELEANAIPDDEDDDYIERGRNVAEDISYILPFYGNDDDDWSDDDDVKLNWSYDDETDNWDDE